MTFFIINMTENQNSIKEMVYNYFFSKENIEKKFSSILKHQVRNYYNFRFEYWICDVDHAVVTSKNEYDFLKQIYYSGLDQKSIIQDFLSNNKKYISLYQNIHRNSYILRFDKINKKLSFYVTSTCLYRGRRIRKYIIENKKKYIFSLNEKNKVLIKTNTGFKYISLKHNFDFIDEKIYNKLFQIHNNFSIEHFEKGSQIPNKYIRDKKSFEELILELQPDFDLNILKLHDLSSQFIIPILFIIPRDKICYFNSFFNKYYPIFKKETDFFNKNQIFIYAEEDLNFFIFMFLFYHEKIFIINNKLYFPALYLNKAKEIVDYIEYCYYNNIKINFNLNDFSLYKDIYQYKIKDFLKKIVIEKKRRLKMYNVFKKNFMFKYFRLMQRRDFLFKTIVKNNIVIHNYYFDKNYILLFEYNSISNFVVLVLVTFLYKNKKYSYKKFDIFYPYSCSEDDKNIILNEIKSKIKIDKIDVIYANF